MTETCPVCGDGIEHLRVETAEESDDESGGTASFDIDDLCSVEPETRWDRICTTAVTADSLPVLEVYYHFFEGE